MLCKYFEMILTRQQTILGHYPPISETPLEWRFAGGPILTRFMCLLRFSFAKGFVYASCYFRCMVFPCCDGPSGGCSRPDVVPSSDGLPALLL